VQFSNRDHPVVIAAARHGLPGLESPSLAVELAPSDIEAVRAFCRADRISGLLARSIRAGDVVIGGGAGSDERESEIDQDWHDALHACVLLEALLVRTAARLEASGIRWLVTKGSAVAHLDYADTATRTFADIDLIVHPSDWGRAETLLAPAAASAPWRRRYVERYGKGTTAQVDGMEVDLHLRYSIGRFGLRCRTEKCFDEPVVFPLADRELPAPSRAHRLLHACFHASLGGDREVRAFRDVAQMALGHPDDVDRMWIIARSWGVESVVSSAVLEAWSRLRLPADHEVVVRARRVEVSRADQRALGVFGRRPGFRPQALTALTELPWAERPRFVYSSWMMSRERRR